MNFTLRPTGRSIHHPERVWIVCNGDRALGLITHRANSRTEEYPYKLFRYRHPWVWGSTPDSTEARAYDLVTVSYGKSAPETKRELKRILIEKVESDLV